MDLNSRDSAVDVGGGKHESVAPDISHIIIERLQRENEKIREQLRKDHQIEITGEGGSPVYATGSLQHGQWRASYGTLWDLGLEMQGDEDASGVPISAWGQLEIRLGGVLYASATSHPVEVMVMSNNDSWDTDIDKEIVPHFGGDVGAWLPIRVIGWPQSIWTAVRDLDIASRRNDNPEDVDVYQFLCDQVVDLFPEATLSFDRISFFGSCVEQRLKNHSLGQISEEEKEHERVASKLYNLVVSHLREAGNDDFGSPFVARVNKVLDAVYMMESPEVAEAAVPDLVLMHLASQTSADYLSEVKERYKSVLRAL